MRRGFCLHTGLRGRRVLWVYPVSSRGLMSEKGRSGCVLEGCMDLDVTDMSWFWDGHTGKTNSVPPQRFSFAL